MRKIPNNSSSVFPTIFAKMLASSCLLYLPDKEMDTDIDEYLEKRERLITFQQLSLATDFETCLQAYYEFELTEHQIQQLSIIYESTRKWLLGHVAGSLIDSLENGMNTGRDKKEISELLFNSFIQQNKEKKEESQNGLLVKLAYAPENGQLKHLITPTSEKGE